MNEAVRTRYVEPEFDPQTRTWFVPGYKREAATIAELLAKLGPSYEAVGYKPLGKALVVRPSSTRIKEPHRVSLRPAKAAVVLDSGEVISEGTLSHLVSRAPSVSRETTSPQPAADDVIPRELQLRKHTERPYCDTEEERRKKRLAGRARYRKRQKLYAQAAQRRALDLAERDCANLPDVPAEWFKPKWPANKLDLTPQERRVHVLAQKKASRERCKVRKALEERATAELPPLPKNWLPMRLSTPKSERTEEWFRAQCSDEQNRALDMWATGTPGPLISQALGHVSNATVAAHWIPRARERGDPRAAVRLPDRYGKKQPWRNRKR